MSIRASTDKPNIILVNCDDLGYGDIGCYGSALNRTPALDRMAAEGVRFSDFYMGSSVCSPSRGAMLTGCYPRRIGFGSFDNGMLVLFPGYSTGLNPSEISMASMLRHQGYATKMVGKWHCGDQPEFLPTRHGFDSYYGLPFSNDMGRQAGREHHFPLPLMRNEEVIQEQPDQAGLTERYVEESVRFLRENRQAPFFLYFAHMYVHRPIYAPPRFLARSCNGSYGAAVACIDWSIDVLLHELRRIGLEQNTLVIFTSDNGSRALDGACNAPLRGAKNTTWEGGLRVPCIAWWPGNIRPGGLCAEIASAMDFLPTFAALAGGRPPDDRVIDGRDIGPLLLGHPGARSPHRAFFYYNKDDLEAVRCGRWKLHVAKGKSEPVRQLYDLVSDMGETVNLYDRELDVVRQLEQELDAARMDLGDTRTGARGLNCRPPGRVANPKPLTTYDPNHPYMVALYDLEDRG